MKAKNKNQKKTMGQSNLKIKLMVIGITAMSMFSLTGCQEKAMVCKTPLSNLSPSDEKIYTMTEISSGYEFTANNVLQNNEPEHVYLIGTQSHAEKLMSMYENNNVSTLNRCSNNQREQDDRGGVPILLITF